MESTSNPNTSVSKENSTLAYWRSYANDPRASPVVAAALEYYRCKLILLDVWASKEVRRFWARASLHDAMDKLEYERFEPLDGMVEAVCLSYFAFEIIHRSDSIPDC